MTTTKRGITILTNRFHNTEYRTTKSRDEITDLCTRIVCGDATASEESFARKVAKTLCGMPDCACRATYLGEC